MEDRAKIGLHTIEVCGYVWYTCFAQDGDSLRKAKVAVVCCMDIFELQYPKKYSE